MPTEKLYWIDPFALAFEARGAALSTWEGQRSVVLPATRFYPEAGGQLGDTGALDLGGVRVDVRDTQITDDGVIHHLTDSSIPEALVADTSLVNGAVDRDRRLDHMAHHTAQHMLSSALADVARADTVSARLGRASCTIDLDVPGTSDKNLALAEDRVNAAIRDDVAIRAFFPTTEELAGLRLRRTPKMTKGIRVIDIEGFDQSPCGGTHCTRTGQIGLVRIVGIEKYKGKVRLSFHAAARALADMRAKDDVIAALMADLTCGPADLAAGLTKLKAELRGSRESLGQARAELAGLVAAAALAKNPPNASGGETLIVLVRESDDIATLRTLAGRLAARPDVVAVCLSRADESDDYSIVVQRGSASQRDCGSWLKRLTSAHGGRGGGRPERAEGRVQASGATSEALAAPSLAAHTP